MAEKEVAALSEQRLQEIRERAARTRQSSITMASGGACTSTTTGTSFWIVTCKCGAQGSAPQKTDDYKCWSCDTDDLLAELTRSRAALLETERKEKEWALLSDANRRRAAKAEAAEAALLEVERQRDSYVALMQLAALDWLIISFADDGPFTRSMEQEVPLPKEFAFSIIVNDAFYPAADAEAFDIREAPALVEVYNKDGNDGVLRWVQEKRNGLPLRPKVEKRLSERDATVARAEAAEQKLAEQRWIPVSEKLPEIRHRVHVWMGNELGSMEGWRDSAGRWIDTDGELRQELVTHWRELPAAPLEEREG